MSIDEKNSQTLINMSIMSTSLSSINSQDDHSPQYMNHYLQKRVINFC